MLSFQMEFHRRWTSIIRYPVAESTSDPGEAITSEVGEEFPDLKKTKHDRAGERSVSIPGFTRELQAFPGVCGHHHGHPGR